MAYSKFDIPAEVRNILERAKDENQRIVLMTCGLSGSGKSTLALNIETQYPTFTRLSIDKTVLSGHGAYGIDYPPERYEELQEKAKLELDDNLKLILREGKGDVVLDLALYSMEVRDGYRQIVKNKGNGVYEIVLIVFKGGEDVLWRRIERRKLEHEDARKEGKEREGMSINREMLRVWLNEFDWPDGEGEIVLYVKD